MTLWRRVAPAIVWVSLASALVTTLVTLVLTGKRSLERVSTEMWGVVKYMKEEPIASRCRTSPEGWRGTMPTGSSFTAWDIDHLPQDGPDEKLLAKIRAGQAEASRFLLAGEHAGVMLMRMAPSGPCSLVELRWRSGKNLPREVALARASILAASSALLAGLLTAFVVAQPLIRRAQRLRTAAKLIGRGPDYVSAADASGDEFGALSSVLDDANERIWSATRQLLHQNEQLQLHLADIAHDLKTPLTAVQLTVEEVARTEPVGATRELMARCLDNCVHLSAMIDNLRVGTALRDGLQPDEARAEAGEIVSLVVRRLGLLGRFKQVEVNMARPDEPVWVACRPLVLERVIDNLVYNAVGHAGEGHHVAVLLEAKDGRFQLTVVDDGPGVTDAELQALGTRLFRGTGAELRAPRGSGLGLSIVAEVCRRCGWTLSYEHHEPHGLKVTISGPTQS